MNDRNSNDESINLTFSNLIIVNRLGRGSTSHVFKTQSIRSKKYYAMKVIDKSTNDYNAASLLKQIEIHQALRHKHISQFVRHFEDEYNHYIVTEYCKDGEITKFLLSPPSEKRLLQVAYEVSSALLYMHNQVGFAHGDLKLSNILINGPILKLCDFGFSVNLSPKLPMQKPSNGPCGTLMYMSPQILKDNRNQYHKEADIWALGICLLTLLLQRKPYTAQSTALLKKQIINGEYIRPSKHLFPQFSSSLILLIQRMLQVDYRKRIKIEEILSNELFSKMQKLSTDSIQSKIVDKSDDCYMNKLQQQEVQGDDQKQGVNKSVFNITVDTLPQSEQSVASNKISKIISYCLKPQYHKNGQDGEIEVLQNHSIRIKIRKTEYVISADGDSIQITKGIKNLKRYSYQQLKLNDKIYDLYNYGAELVSILKKKQCLKQQFVNGNYFWASKNSIGCLFPYHFVFERYFEQKQIIYTQLNGTQYKDRTVDENSNYERLLQMFNQGQKYMLSKINKC